METIILILLVFLTFLSELIAFSSLKNARGFAFALIGFISAIIGSLIVFFTKESGLQSSYLFFPEWFLISFFGGLILAIPVLQKRADILLLKLSDVTYKTRRWVLLLLIPYFFLFYISTLSNAYKVTVGQLVPVYDQAFFYRHLPFWIFYLISIGGSLYLVFEKTEIRQKGIIYFHQFIDWLDVISFSWYELDDQARVSVKYKRILWLKPTSIVLLVPSEKQQIVRDILLAKNIKEE